VQHFAPSLTASSVALLFLAFNCPIHVADVSGSPCFVSFVVFMLALYSVFHFSRCVYHQCNIDWWVCPIVNVGWPHSSGKQAEVPFGYPDRFSVVFLSCKANAMVFDAKSGHGPHSPPPGEGDFTPAPDKRRITPVCDRASLGSEPRQPTNQSLSHPHT